ncbi:MAG: pilus assembly protein PilM [Desulfurispora sp.]|uniref:pilus assembly protein PilM n=1 Tax=Desulfurispora sp. TaxID=3014275 RepID=UPI00404936E4
MALLSRCFAGIDLGSRHVKMALVTRNRQQWTLAEQQLLPLPAYADSSPAYLPPAGETGTAAGSGRSAYTEILVRLADNPRLKKATVVSALPGSQVLTRHIMLPPMPEKEIARALSFELEKILPGHTGQMITRHINLGRVSTPEGPRQHILLAAAARDAVLQHYDLFQQAGLKLAAIDLAQLALWRIFGPGRFFQAEASAYAVVDIGDQNTHLLIINSGRLAFTRTLNTGGHQVLETMGIMLGTGAAGALEMLQSFPNAPLPETAPAQGEILSAGEDFPAVLSLEDESSWILTANRSEKLPAGREAAAALEQTGLSAALTTALAELLREIRRSLDFYKLQERQSELEKIFITGGTAQLPLLAETAAAELGLPAEVGRPDLPGKEQPNPHLSIAYGLALREI